MRLDLALVVRQSFESRAKAREAIEAGLVFVNGARAQKPSQIIGDKDVLEAQAPYPWVSRGGVKLAAALDAFAIDPAGRACLDIGASTGGFTDVLLTRGAKSVIAVDVGSNQLHPRLRTNADVTIFENFDARKLTSAEAGAPDVIVFDVSFISLKLIIPHVLQFAAENAACVALVKPQFEVGPKFVKKGLVRDPLARKTACDDVKAMFAPAGWSLIGEAPSPIAGGDGNIEFLLGARKNKEF